MAEKRRDVRIFFRTGLEQEIGNPRTLFLSFHNLFFQYLQTKVCCIVLILYMKSQIDSKTTL